MRHIWEISLHLIINIPHMVKETSPLKKLRYLSLNKLLKTILKTTTHWVKINYAMDNLKNDKFTNFFV